MTVRTTTLPTVATLPQLDARVLTYNWRLERNRNRGFKIKIIFKYHSFSYIINLYDFRVNNIFLDQWKNDED